MSPYSKQPALRGIFHAVAAVILPGIILQMLSEGAKFDIIPIALAGEFQFVMSAMLHLNPHRHNTTWYNRVRRLDHAAIITGGFIIAYGYGIADPLMTMIYAVNLATKLLGSTDWTAYNICGIVCQYVYATYRIIKKGDDLTHFAIMTPYSIAAFLVYTYRWPLRDNPVFGYHEIMHLCSLVILALMIAKKT